MFLHIIYDIREISSIVCFWSLWQYHSLQKPVLFAFEQIWKITWFKICSNATLLLCFFFSIKHHFIQNGVNGGKETLLLGGDHGHSSCETRHRVASNFDDAFYLLVVDSIVQWGSVGLGWIFEACFHLFLKSTNIILFFSFCSFLLTTFYPYEQL